MKFFFFLGILSLVLGQDLQPFTPRLTSRDLTPNLVGRQVGSACQPGFVLCNQLCIRIGLVCCPAVSDFCFAQEYCVVDNNGTPGCCPSGQICTGEVPTDQTTDPGSSSSSSESDSSPINIDDNDDNDDEDDSSDDSSGGSSGGSSGPRRVGAGSDPFFGDGASIRVGTGMLSLLVAATGLLI